jgi:hypothetical protein
MLNTADNFEHLISSPLCRSQVIAPEFYSNPKYYGIPFPVLYVMVL